MSEEKEAKISYDVAGDEFERFADAWDLDTDVETMTEEDSEGFNQNKRKIVRQIVGGRAAVNTEGDIDYTLFQQVGSLDSITLERPGGRAYLAMDRAKEGKSITKFNNMMGEAIKQSPTVISRMDGIDVKFLQAVYVLFLGS